MRRLLNVPLAELITNQLYEDLKKLYNLKPVLEQAGLYPLPITTQNFAGL
jgi:hypothetical protein